MQTEIGNRHPSGGRAGRKARWRSIGPAPAVALLALSLGACAFGKPKEIRPVDLGYDPAKLTSFTEVYDCTAPPPKKYQTLFRAVVVTKETKKADTTVEFSGRMEITIESDAPGGELWAMARTGLTEFNVNGRAFTAATTEPLMTLITVTSRVDGTVSVRNSFQAGNMKGLPRPVAAELRDQIESSKSPGFGFRSSGYVLAMGRSIPGEIEEIYGLEEIEDLRMDSAAEVIGKTELIHGEAVVVRSSLEGRGRVGDLPMTITVSETQFYDPEACAIFAKLSTGEMVITGNGRTWRRTKESTLQTIGLMEVR